MESQPTGSDVYDCKHCSIRKWNMVQRRHSGYWNIEGGRAVVTIEIRMENLNLVFMDQRPTLISERYHPASKSISKNDLLDTSAPTNEGLYSTSITTHHALRAMRYWYLVWNVRQCHGGHDSQKYRVASTSFGIPCRAVLVRALNFSPMPRIMTGSSFACGRRPVSFRVEVGANSFQFEIKANPLQWLKEITLH